MIYELLRDLLVAAASYDALISRWLHSYQIANQRKLQQQQQQQQQDGSHGSAAAQSRFLRQLQMRAGREAKVGVYMKKECVKLRVCWEYYGKFPYNQILK